MTEAHVEQYRPDESVTAGDRTPTGSDPFAAARLAPPVPDQDAPGRTNESLYRNLGIASSSDLLCAITGGDPPASPVPTPQAIGQSWEATYQARLTAARDGSPLPSFSQTNEQLQTAILDAYRRGGPAAVNQLMLDVNAAVPSARVGPIIVPNGTGFDIHNARVLTQEQYQQLQQANPARTDLHAIQRMRTVGDRREPTTMYIQDMAPAHHVDTFGTPRRLDRAQTQQVIDAAQREIDAARPPLTDAQQQQLLTAMYHVARGDMSALARMLPTGENGMSHQALDAFTRAMGRLGINVDLVDSGTRQNPRSTLLLVRQGSTEAIRIHHDHGAAPGTHHYSAESVNVRSGMWRAIVPGTISTDPATVTTRLRALGELLTPPAR